MDDELKNLLKRQHYRIVGNHSAVKLCHWLRKSLLEDRFCYKQKFYGIRSHGCLQMTPAVIACTQKCLFCWRPTQFTETALPEYDPPDYIVEESLKAQKALLAGYFGLPGRVSARKLKEAQDPGNVAISLAGEPTLYPELSELIRQYKSRGMTTFLVSNGTNPEILESLELPWNLYLTLAAPTEAIYKKLCHPQTNGWSEIMETVSMFSQLETQRVIRLTLVNQFNMVHPEGYARLIERAAPDFVEAKAYMFVGYSRHRMTIENMPSFLQVQEFAHAIEEHSSYEVCDSQSESRVVLLRRS
ncbi:MAG: 4-demethylwyosine synthase TYW1 [Theionarchaea archaeon]|nr:4-demethylwyosine synthase TYW1 [Theionarchaea archaeon]MBU7037731.1 4-demethylwyosine synthase TYW1 [Theionarchaea archaeon]